LRCGAAVSPRRGVVFRLFNIKRGEGVDDTTFSLT